MSMSGRSIAAGGISTILARALSAAIIASNL